MGADCACKIAAGKRPCQREDRTGREAGGRIRVHRLLSLGEERVGNVRHVGRRVSGHYDRDNIETAGRVGQTAVVKIPAGGLDEATLLGGGDTLLGVLQRSVTLGFDFDEHDRVPIGHDEVDFAHRRRKTPRQCFATGAAKMFFGEAFTPQAEFVSGVGHGVRRVKATR